MNPSTQKEAQQLAHTIANVVDNKKGTVIIVPPALYIDTVKKEYTLVGMQDVSEYKAGAYTGQLSARMAKDKKIQYVIVGHSERRKYQNETDAQVAQKVLRAQEEKLIPIICIGEQKKINASQAWNIIKKQIDFIIPILQPNAKYIVAYEPVWAIGGGKEVNASYANEVIYRIKLYIRARTKQIPLVLYGGSVDGKNIHTLLYYANNIDGFLVGSASVKQKEILSVIKTIYGHS
jgi:triosephosphate isomerase